MTNATYYEQLLHIEFLCFVGLWCQNQVPGVGVTCNWLVLV